MQGNDNSRVEFICMTIFFSKGKFVKLLLQVVYKTGLCYMNRESHFFFVWVLPVPPLISCMLLPNFKMMKIRLFCIKQSTQ